ncbi:Crossover junction endonuclease mus81 [Dionaea muscipula]
MRKQELIDAAEASGLSRVPIAPEKGKGKPGHFGSSLREWYSGWSCMKKLIAKGSGENRRRDDDVDAPEEEAEEEDEGNKDDFDWEAVVEEAAVEGEFGSGEKFYDAEDKDQSSPEANEEIPAAVPQGSAQQNEQGTSGVDPSCPTGRIPKVEMTRLQAEFERKRVNRFLADFEKAKAENTRLLALLHQAQSKPHP